MIKWNNVIRLKWQVSYGKPVGFCAKECNEFFGCQFSLKVQNVNISWVLIMKVTNWNTEPFHSFSEFQKAGAPIYECSVYSGQ